MGNKSVAREIMKNANVPVIPGSDGLIENIEEAKIEAKRIGYPIMIKASLGGGGKGIRIVANEDELENAFFTARTEAKNNFGDDSVYMEKFIENPRHIEFSKFLGDTFWKYNSSLVKEIVYSKKESKKYLKKLHLIS